MSALAATLAASSTLSINIGAVGYGLAAIGPGIGIGKTTAYREVAHFLGCALDDLII